MTLKFDYLSFYYNTIIIIIIFYFIFFIIIFNINFLFLVQSKTLN